MLFFDGDNDDDDRKYNRGHGSCGIPGLWSVSYDIDDSQAISEPKGVKISTLPSVL